MGNTARTVTAIWDKENNTVTLNKDKVCKVLIKRVDKEQWQNYGSGGWIEGKEKVVVTFVTYELLYKEFIIGCIDTYNVMFPGENKYKINLYQDFRTIFPKNPCPAK